MQLWHVTFATLFDTFLSPRGIPIPWLCLLAAAGLGSVEFAEVFEQRQQRWCNRVETEEPIRGLPVWPTQIKKAVWAGKFEYIDFMIRCGADINIGGVEQSAVASLVGRQEDDGKFL
jgi:hypothetical protein